MTQPDRRIQSTRELPQTALIELLGERGYAAIVIRVIRDIAERANGGHTTFSLHYRSRDALCMGCHEANVSEFRIGPLHPLSPEDLLSPEAPPGMTAAYRHLADARALMYRIFQGKGSLLILRRIRGWSAPAIEASLRAAFAEADSAIPFDVPASYPAGVQLALAQWWLERRQPHTPANLAQMFHRLRRAASRAAFGLRDGE